MISVDRMLGVLALILGIAGLATGYYFYEASIREPVPTFLVDPVRATIIDSSGPNLSDLTVNYKGKPVGLHNVTAVRVYFWNSGKMPIRRADVLRPVRCILGDGVEILDYRVLKSSRDVAGVKVLAPPGSASNEVTIDFDILERGDGAAIQIIYAGPPTPSISFEGVVVGAAKIAQETPRELQSNFSSPDRFIGWTVAATGALGLILGFMFWRVRAKQLPSVPTPKLRLKEIFRALLETRDTRRLNAALVLVGLLYLVVGLRVAMRNPSALADVPPSIIASAFASH